MTPDPATAVPSTAGMTTKVIKGSIWTLAGQVAPLVASFAATPFVVHQLGAEAYGVLVLITIIPVSLAFADLGMGTASTRFASVAYAEGDANREGLTVRTASSIALLIAIPAGVLMCLLSNQIAEILRVPAGLLSDASTAIKISSLTLVFGFLNNIANTPQLTRLRMDTNTAVSAGFRIAAVIAMPFVIYAGGGITGAAILILAANVLIFLGHIYFSAKLLPGLLALSIDRSLVRPLLKFGVPLATASVAAIVLTNAEKGILSATISPAALAYYYVAFQLMNMMTLFSAAMAQSLIPAFSQLQGDRNRDQLNLLYSRGIRVNLIWIVPAIVGLSLAARPFFIAWGGPDFGRESYVPFFVLLTGVVVNVVAYYPASAVVASGKTEILAKVYWIEAGPYVALVWLLTQNFGIVGAAAACSIRMIVDAIIWFLVAGRMTGARFSHPSKPAFVLAALIMLIPLGVLLLTQMLPLAIATAIAAGIVYAIIIFKKVLEKDEAAWLVDRIRSRLPRYPR